MLARPGTWKAFLKPLKKAENWEGRSSTSGSEVNRCLAILHTYVDHRVQRLGPLVVSNETVPLDQQRIRVRETFITHAVSEEYASPVQKTPAVPQNFVQKGFGTCFAAGQSMSVRQKLPRRRSISLTVDPQTINAIGGHQVSDHAVKRVLNLDVLRIQVHEGNLAISHPATLDTVLRVVVDPAKRVVRGLSLEREVLCGQGSIRSIG
jgi:hypothetical protein